MANSIFTSRQDGCSPAIGQTVNAVLGLNCNYTLAELQEAIKSTIRTANPYRTNGYASEAFFTPATIPAILPLTPGSSRSFAETRPLTLQYAPYEMMLTPTPIPTETAYLGPDVGSTQQVALVLGLGTFENKPILQIPQFSSAPVQGSVAWQDAIALFGWVLRVSWTDNDRDSYLEIGREFTNVPNSRVELARINAIDDCQQCSVFLPYWDPTYSFQDRGSTYVKWTPQSYYSQSGPGDTFIGNLPSLNPWTFRVMQGNSVKTTGYSFLLEMQAVPLTIDMIETLVPTYNGNRFVKP